MKKIYNQPTMVVTEVKLQQMIAGSLPKSTDEITDPNAILSRRRRRNNDWDDEEWEDEEY